MKRAIVIGLGVLAVAAAALPAIALAQSGVPPKPPATFYGTVPAGAVQGQGVIAIVSNGALSTVCGSGKVQPDTDHGNVLSYAVDVVAADQTAGCGTPGATVRFYFTPAPGSTAGGALVVDTATWNGAGPVNKNLTAFGPALTRRGFTGQTAKDGSF
jgi:hypothetical protein